MYIKDIHVRRAPGLGNGLKDINGFSPDINIVHGNNAVGKSTTARMIQKLIWRDATKGLIVDGTLVESQEDASKEWRVVIDSDNVSVQRDGQPFSPSDMPSADFASRYMLSLPDLISHSEKDKDDGLLKEILLQIRGGLDLDKAFADLAYVGTRRGMANPAYKAYKSASDGFAKEYGKQKSLIEEMGNLEAWERDHANAVKAGEERTWYEGLVEYIRQSQAFKESEARLGEFDKRMEKVGPDDVEKLVGLEQSLGKIQTEIEKLKQRLESANASILASGLPDAGCREQDLEELKGYLEYIENADREMQKCRQDYVNARGKAASHLKEFGAADVPEDWMGLTDSQVGKLDEHYTKSLDNRNGLSEVDHRISILESDLKGNVSNIEQDTDRVRDAIRHLGDWLRYHRETGMPPFVYLLLLGLVGFSTTFLAWKFRSFGLYLTVGFVLLLAVFLLILRWRAATSRNAMRIIEKNYADAGLPTFDVWSPDAVSKAIERLVESMNLSKRIQLQKAALSESHERKRVLLEEKGRLDETWQELGDEIHGLPVHDPTRLFWHLKSMLEWRQAILESKGHEEALVYWSGKSADLLDKCGTLLTVYGIDRPSNPVEAKSRIEILKNRSIHHREAIVKRIEAEEGLEAKRGESNDVQEQIRSFYKSRDLDLGDRVELLRLIGMIEDYEKAQNDLNAKRAVMDTGLNGLKKHSLFGRFAIDSEKPFADLEKEAGKAADSAGLKEKLYGEIKSLKDRIAGVEKENNLQDLLAAKESALDALEQDFNEGLSSIAGNLWYQALRDRSERVNRPKVLERADGIFKQVTSGRYKLQVSQNGVRGFRAYDIHDRMSKELSELSTGTRIQLLMSVRLAFVECQEERYRLPLLADELMATSDDQRSLQIVQALVGIARTGRQVFYFTAEADEVVKWRLFLNGQEGLDPRFIEIGRHEAMVLKDYQPLPFTQPVHIPEPDGHDRDSYRSLIGVPSYDLLHQVPDQLHLWYLTDDLQLLRDCLQLGVQTYGQFKHYSEGMGSGADPRWHAALDAFKLKAKLLEYLQQLWLQGRNRPIGRSELEASKAVSPSFMNKLNDKLNALNGDPLALVHSLKNKEVPHFRDDATERLEQYLKDEGFIAEGEQMPSEVIVLQLSGLMTSIGMKVEEGRDFLERVMHPKS